MNLLNWLNAPNNFVSLDIQSFQMCAQLACLPINSCANIFQTFTENVNTEQIMFYFFLKWWKIVVYNLNVESCLNAKIKCNLFSIIEHKINIMFCISCCVEKQLDLIYLYRKLYQNVFQASWIKFPWNYACFSIKYVCSAFFAISFPNSTRDSCMAISVTGPSLFFAQLPRTHCPGIQESWLDQAKKKFF